MDAAAVGILLLGATIVATKPPSLTAGPAPPPVAFMATSLGVYAVGSPIIHVAHGNFLQACGSIGLRAALPLAGFALGAAADGASKHASGAADSVFGVVLGSAGAMAADAGVLAWRRWYGADTRTALFRFQGSF